MKSYILCSVLFLLGFIQSVYAGTFYINQVGYDASGPKVAVLETTAGVTDFQVLNSSNDVVFTASAGSQETVTEWWSNKRFYQLDFSAVTQKGQYTLKAVGVSGESDVFSIDNLALFKKTLAMNLSYFNASRADQYTNTGTVNWDLWNTDGSLGFVGKSGTNNVQGGWYDASSDVSKYLSHLNYGNFTQPQQIPMSAYSMADIYDRVPEQLEAFGIKSNMQNEALWGADYLVRVLDPAGYFYITIFDGWSGDLNDREICAFEGIDGTKTSEYQAGFREGAGVSIATLARVSTWGVTGSFTSAEYLNAAVTAWNHLTANNFQKAKQYADDGILNFLDAFSILVAATELYNATGEAKYLTEAEAQIDEFNSRMHADGYFIADNSNRPFYHAIDAGLPIVILSRFLDLNPNNVKAPIARALIEKSLDYFVSVTDAVTNPFGYARQHVKTGGSIKTSFFIPHDNETGYWWQGESARLGSLASAMLYGGRHIATASPTHLGVKSAYHNYAMRQLSWILGQNPYGICYLEGVGSTNPPHYPYEGIWHGHRYGGISNGITGSVFNSDGSGITYNDVGNMEPWQNWRWLEQHIPHAHWMMMAVAATGIDQHVEPTPTDVALNKSATSSSNESSTYSASKAVDGSGTTRWASAFADPQWIAVDLDGSYDVSSVVLSWENAYGSQYTIQVSDDGSNWNTIHTETNGNGGTDNISVTAEKVSHVRMRGTKRATQWGYSLYSFEVYGIESQTEPPVLTSVVVTPASVTVREGNQQQYTAQGKDQYGVDITAPFIWNVSGGGSIDVDGLFTATTEGAHTITAESGVISETVSVTVEAAPVLSSITLTPTTQTIRVDETQLYLAEGFDQYGAPKTASFVWSTNGGGSIDAAGLFTASFDGDFTITVESGSVSQTASLTIQAAPVVTSLVVSPLTAVVPELGTKQFSAEVLDQYGATISAIVTWSVDGGGSISSNGLFTAGSVADVFTVTAQVGSISETASIEISESPVLTTMSITPTVTTVSVGNTQQFSAQGFDQFGATIETSVTWSVEGNGGSISLNGLFSATNAGVATSVVATDGAVQVSAVVTIIQEASDVALGKSASATSVESGYPASNVIDGSASTRWSSDFSDAESITIDLEDSYSIESIKLVWEAAYGKSYTIRVSNNGTNWTTIHTESNSNGGTDNITVSADDVAYVRLQGVDRATQWGYSLFTFEVYGIPYNPEPPVLTSIVVSPDPVAVTQFDDQQFTAHAFDQYGKTYNTPFTWSVNGVASIDQLGLFSSSETGVFTVTASAGLVSDVAMVTVNEPAELATIILTPTSATVEVGATEQFTAQGFDQFGSPISAALSWSVVGIGGTVSDVGLFTATTVDNATQVVVESGSVTAVATIEVIEITAVNMLTNGDFSNGKTAWSLANMGTGNASYSIIAGEADFNIVSGGTEKWNVQFSQLHVPLVNGRAYRLSFDARASSNRTIDVKLETDGSPWTNYGGTPPTAITTVMDNYEYTFTMNQTDTDARIVFNIGDNNSDIVVDNITLIELP